MKKIVKPHKARKPSASTDVPSFARGKDRKGLIQRTAEYNAWRSRLPKNLQKETSDYDLYGAFEAGLQPEWNKDNKSYHLGSRDPKTGRILKRPTHPTFNEAIYSDMSLGYTPIYKDGEIYTIKPLKNIEDIPKITKRRTNRYQKNKKIDERIANKQGYGWNNPTETNSGYGWNRERLKRSINPTAKWSWTDAPRQFISYLFNNDYTTDEGYKLNPGSKALWERHLGFPRDFNYMPITGIRFSGDYNKDGSLRLPNAKYTGIPKAAKQSILREIQDGDIEIDPYGKWTQRTENFKNNDFDLEQYANFGIRENNKSGIYDMFDTYDFEPGRGRPAINRLPGTQIEVRDTIWGPNAIPELYDEDFNTERALQIQKELGYNKGKDSGIHIKKANRGKFTAAAKRAGMGVQAYARKILSAPKGKYSPQLRRRANFARNASKFKH